MADKLTTLERQAAVTAVCTVQDCIAQYGRPHVVLAFAMTIDGNAAGNAIWESEWSDLPADTIKSVTGELIDALGAKREEARQVRQDAGQCGDWAPEGRDVLI